MKVISITGASGFIGKALVKFLNEKKLYRLNLLTRDKLRLDYVSGENIQVHEGNLLERNSLNEFIEPGCTILNLAYLTTEKTQRNLLAAKNLIEAGTQKRAKRIVHCSTATVVGKNRNEIIDENSVCYPTTEYEKVKLAIEEAFLQSAKDDFDIRILRPTAVFGPGGENLFKFADALDKGNSCINYLRNTFFGKRKLNLVCLENVVGALQFLIEHDTERYGKIFIISDDDDPTNNYHDIQNIILSRLGKSHPDRSNFFFPPSVLTLLLSLRGRSNTSLKRIYSAERITLAGYQKRISLETGLERFINWYLNDCPR